MLQLPSGVVTYQLIKPKTQTVFVDKQSIIHQPNFYFNQTEFNQSGVPKFRVNSEK